MKAVAYFRVGSKEQLTDKNEHIKDLSVLRRKMADKLFQAESDAATKAVEEYFKAKEQS